MEELVSAVEGSEESVHICGVEAGKSTCAVRDFVSNFDVVDRKNLGSNNKATTIDLDNDNENDKDDSTTSYAQRHGLVDLVADRGETSPGRFPHEVLKLKTESNENRLEFDGSVVKAPADEGY